jgi:hypothetical protein
MSDEEDSETARMTRTPIPPDYIGDSIYIKEGNWQGAAILYLDNGTGAHNSIVIEQEQLEAIVRFTRRMGWEVNP